jgi:hypothetical protein
LSIDQKRDFYRNQESEKSFVRALKIEPWHVRPVNPHFMTVATYSAMAGAAVNPGDSIPRR